MASFTLANPVGKILAMISHKPTDPYSVYLPNISPAVACIWLIRVTSVTPHIMPDSYIFTGPMLFNADHDIAGPFSTSTNTYTMLLTSANILGIYVDPSFTMTDIANLEAQVLAR